MSRKDHDLEHGLHMHEQEKRIMGDEKRAKGAPLDSKVRLSQANLTARHEMGR